MTEDVEKRGTRAADPAGSGDEPEPTACHYTEYRSGPDPADLPATGADAEGVEARVWEALRGVQDPEMPVSIVDLGLVYGVGVTGGEATVTMTLTYTGCPARNMLTRDVETAVKSVEGVESAEVGLVWSPEWSVEMVTEQGKDDLREFGLSV
jgi:metal-sulfur cluster biosynthetic enzyme